jgi:hypothetical protein
VPGVRIPSGAETTSSPLRSGDAHIQLFVTAKDSPGALRTTNVVLDPAEIACARQHSAASGLTTAASVDPDHAAQLARLNALRVSDEPHPDVPALSAPSASPATAAANTPAVKGDTCAPPGNQSGSGAVVGALGGGAGVAATGASHSASGAHEIQQQQQSGSPSAEEPGGMRDGATPRPSISSPQPGPDQLGPPDTPSPSLLPVAPGLLRPLPASASEAGPSQGGYSTLSSDGGVVAVANLLQRTTEQAAGTQLQEKVTANQAADVDQEPHASEADSQARQSYCVVS